MKNPNTKTQTLQDTLKKVANTLKSYSTANTNSTTKVDNINGSVYKGSEPTAKTVDKVKSDFTTDTKSYTPTTKETEKGKTFTGTTPAVGELTEEDKQKLKEMGEAYSKAIKEEQAKETESYHKDVAADFENLKKSYNNDLSSLYNADGNDLYDYQTELDNALAEQTEIQKKVNSSTLSNEDIYNYAQRNIELANIIKNTNQKIKDQDVLKKYYESQYIQNDATDEEKEAFNESASMAANSDDTTGEKVVKYFDRKANALGATTAGLINEIPQLVTNIEYYANEANADNIENKATIGLESGRYNLEEYNEMMDKVGELRAKNILQDEESFSYKMNQIAAQYNQNAFFGASEIETMMTQAEQSTVQFLVHYAVGNAVAGTANTALSLGKNAKEVAEIAGEISNASMALTGATQRTYELLTAVDENGNRLYTDEQALGNGLLTGVTSYVVEKVGMDNFVKTLTGGDYLADAINHSVNYVLKNTGKQALSEGLEEVAEGLVDPAIDLLTGVADTYEVDGNEILTSFIVGGLAGGMSGAYASIKFNISTKRQYNICAEELVNLEGMYNNYIKNGDAKGAELAEATMQKVKDAMSVFEAKSSAMGIDLASDYTNSTTNEEDRRMMFDSFTADFNKEIQEYRDVQSAYVNTMEQLGNYLSNYGIDTNIEDFAAASQEVRDNVLKTNEWATAKGAPVEFKKQLTNDSGEPLYYNGKPVGAKYNTKTNKIEISFNADKGMVSALIHEYAHFAEKGESYNTMKTSLIKEIGQEQFDQEVKNWMSQNNVSKEIAESEIVAQNIENLLGNEAFASKLAKYNKSFAYRLLQDIKHIVKLGGNVGDIEYNLMKAIQEANKVETNENVDKYSIGGEKAMENLRKTLFEDNPSLQNKTIEVNGKTITYLDFYYDSLNKYNEATKMHNEKNADGSPKYTEKEIHKATNWWVGNDGKGRYEFYDDGSIDKLADYVKNEKNGWKTFQKASNKYPKIKDILGEDSLFLAMYPKLKDVKFFVNNAQPHEESGYWWAPFNVIEIHKYGNDYDNYSLNTRGNIEFGPLDLDYGELKNTIAHEVGHAIQEYEGFKQDMSVSWKNRPHEHESVIQGNAQQHEDMRYSDFILNWNNYENKYKRYNDLDYKYNDNILNFTKEKNNNTNILLDALKENAANNEPLMEYFNTIAKDVKLNSHINGQAVGLAKKILKYVHGSGFNLISYDDISRVFDEKLKGKEVKGGLFDESYGEQYKQLMKLYIANQVGLEIPVDVMYNAVNETNNQSEGKSDNEGNTNVVGEENGQGNSNNTNEEKSTVSDSFVDGGEDYETGSQDDTWQYSEGESYEPTVEEQSEETVDNGARVIEEPEAVEEEAQEEIAKVLTENPNTKKGKLQVKQLVDKVKYYLSDFGVYLDNFAKSVGNEEISHKYDYMLSSNGLANNALASGHYDIYGRQIDKGISKVFEGIKGEAKEDFFNYLYHYRNYDEMSIGRRVAGKLDSEIQANAETILKTTFGVTDFDGKHYLTVKQNGQDVMVEMTEDAYADLQNRALELAKQTTTVDKPVFGESVTAEDSKKAIEEYEKKYNGEGSLDFKKLAEEVWNYERNELQILMQYGLISEEEMNHMMATSQHWVPIQRNVDNQRIIGGALNANKAVAGFEGSTQDILPLDETILNRTRQVYRSITQNNLFNEIFKSVKVETTKGGNYNINADSAEDLGISEDHGKHYITFYQNGEGIKMEIGEDIYKSLRNHKTYKVPGLSNIADFRRNIITGWNPIFWVTNGIKDIQDVPYNTKFKANEYTKAYMDAWKQVTTNGDLYKLYLANGGAQNNLTQLGEETKVPDSLKGLVGFGETIETTPRLAEFIATLNNGGTIEEAMHNAAEVTTNFKRGGTVSKTLNANGFTFLNASIVGFQKQINNYKNAYDKKGIVGMASYMAKMALFYNVPLMLLNHLRWKDDDEYEELSEYVKQNYYIVGKTEDGTFIRLPKGRLNAFYQTVIQSKVDWAQGEQTLWEALLEDWASFKTNIAPNELSESSIIAPITQALTNTTWYGGDIVPTRLQNVPDAEQYDASTDELSKWIGEKTGLSPMKIHYVLDQYTGVLGDAVLPAITLDASNGIDNKVLSSLLSPVLDKFTTNSTLKNQYVSDFYDMNEELEKNANSSNATDEDVLAYRYMGTITSQLSDLYKQKREIQSDETLSNGEKYDKVLEVQDQIDELAKYGLENYDQLDIVDNYASVGGVQYYKNEDGWKKLTESQLERIEGLDLTSQEKSDFYGLYDTINAEREKVKEATPAGQDSDYREVTIGAIQNSNFSSEVKNRLYDSYYGSKFSEYTNDLDLDSDTKLSIKYIYSMTDADYENGKAVSNSKASKIKAQYEELGVYDKILEYIKANNLEYSSFGLTKTVVEGTTKTSGTSTNKNSYASAYAKALEAFTSGNKTSSNKSSSTVNTSSTGAENASYNKEGYAKAYASALKNLNSQKISNDSRSRTCSNCGNKVVPVNGRCPICGNGL